MPVNQENTHRSFSLLNAAEYVNEHCRDRKWSKRLLVRALESSDDCIDMAMVAGSIIRELNDRKWARKILEEAVFKTEDANDLLFVIHHVINPDELGDREWAIHLLQELEKYQLDEIEEIIYETILDDYNITAIELETRRAL